MSKTRWSCAGDVVAPAGQVLMEALCLRAVLIGATTFADGTLHVAPSLGELVGLGIAVAWAGRLAAVLPWPDRWTRAVLIPLTGVLALVWLHHVLVPSAPWTPAAWVDLLTQPTRLDPRLTYADRVVGWGLSGLIWVRGLRIGLHPLSAVELSCWLLGSLAVLLVLAIVAAVLPGRLPGDLAPALGRLTTAYVAVALVEVALVHTQTGYRFADVRQSVSASWLLGVLLPIAATFGIAFLVTHGVDSALRLALQGGLLAVQLLARLAFWVLQGLAYLLAWLLSWLPEGSPLSPHELELPDWFDWRAPTLGELPTGEGVHVPPVLAASVFLLLFGIALYYLLRPRPRRATTPVAEDRSSLWSWRLFVTQVRQLLDLLAIRLRRARPAPSPGPDPVVTTSVVENDVRSLYRRLLLRAAAQGIRRPVSRTPREHAPYLAQVPGLPAGFVARLTLAYRQVRYGEAAADATVVEDARRELTAPAAPAGDERR